MSPNAGPPDGRPARRVGVARALAAVALLAVLIGASLAAWHYRGSTGLGFVASVDGVMAQLRAWGPWAAAGSIVLMVAHSLVPFPAELVTIANGMLFGPVWGIVITWSGAMLGAALGFALARWFGHPFVDALLNPDQRRTVERWAQRQGIGVLLLARLMPLISFNLVNYAAGLTPVSWWTFLWTTGIGILPFTVVLVLTGHQLWNGSGVAWAGLGAVVLAGMVIWALVAARRRG